MKALTPPEILNLVTSRIKEYQRTQLAGKKHKPEYHPTYQVEVEMAAAQKVHALGKYPYDLFDRKIPNETEEQRSYRKESFEAITMPHWGKAVQAIQGRIWNESNHSIIWPTENEAAQAASEYFSTKYPDDVSLVAFFRNERLPVKLYDANAVMTIEIPELPTIEMADGETMVDDTELLEPVAKIYDSKKVWHIDKYCLLVLSDETSTVEYAGRLEQTGLVFLFIDEYAYYQIRQTGKKIDWEFEVSLWYQHNLDYLPAKRLGGVPRSHKSRRYYNSYFWPAVGDLNTALFDESTLTISKVANIFPERWEVVEDCQTCGGTGKIADTESTSGLVTCTSCQGSGTFQRPHPTNAITVKLPDRFDDRPAAPTPPAGYLQKDTDSIKFLREEIDRKIADAFAHLNIDITTRPNGQTATESKIDREELFSFLLQIASEEFTALGWAMDTIGTLRYGEAWQELAPTIDAPTDFTIRSYKEITQELNDAKEANIPTIAFRKLLDEYHAARFNMDTKVGVLTDIVFEADRLVTLTEEEVSRQVLAGLASKREAIIHTSIYTFIDRLIQENPVWLNKPRTEQIADITRLADEVVTTIPAPGTRDILSELGNQ